MDMTARLHAAETIARKAGEMLRNHGNIRISKKSENDFVTEMDLRSEAMIREYLLEHFPEDEFFGEEGGGATEAEGRWIVDPIDGTASFMRGHPCYTISIAYEYHGKLEIGCIYAPQTDEMFSAARGCGATLNGEPIRVSDTDNPRQAIAHLGYGHRVSEYFDRTLPLLPDMFRRISDIRRYGSAAYALACVASGRSDIFFELGLNIYDIAAGVVLVEEAGGTTGSWDNGENFLETGNIIATNGLLQQFTQDQLSGK